MPVRASAVVAALVLAVAAVVLAVAGCGGGAKPKADPERQGSAAKVPTLHRAWAIPALRTWENPTTSPLPTAWTVGDVLVVPTRTAVIGLDARSGATRWTRRVGKVCGIAVRPNAAGVVAVLAGGGAGGVDQGCTALLTIDGATGRRTQRIDLTRSTAGRRGYGFTDVAVGDEAVVASNGCDAADAFALDTGRRTRSLFPGGVEGQCINAFASDGRTTFQGAAEVDPEHFTAYDALRGRKAFDVAVPRRRRFIDPNPTVERVISSDPLIVDASLYNDRFLRLVDPDRRTQTPIGRETSDSTPPVLTEVVDGRLLVQYAGTRALFVIDARTGEQERRIPLGEGQQAVGVRDGQVISIGAPTQPVFGDVALVVRSTDPATGRQTVLGTAPASGTEAFLGIRSFLSGSTLVVPTTDRWAAYRLPARGVSADGFEQRVRWAPGDVRPEMTEDLCTGVTEATKRRLDFIDPTLPAPARCDWNATTTADGFIQLRVDGFAIEPGRGTTATAAAHATAVKSAGPSTVDERPAMTPRSGLGDEAWARTTRDRGEPTFEYVVREDNAVLLVSLTSRKPFQGPPPTGLAASTRAAVRDVLAELARRR